VFGQIGAEGGIRPHAGLTGGGRMFEPMAITILFGLLFAMTLTLGIVPVLYSLFFRVKYKDFVY
jgi:multidrug efflux pump subunit AcrB